MKFRPGATISAIVCCFFLVQTVSAQALHEPAKGSVERRQILDAVRASSESEMGGPVEFVVTSLRAEAAWAFAKLEPQRPGGASIDPAETVFENPGDMDGLTVYALVRRNGDGWVLVDHVVGPTDVSYGDWPDRYGAPAGIFGFD